MPNDLIPAPRADVARQEPERAAAPTPMELIAAIARDPSIPIERIAGIIGLQERMEARQAETMYHIAMAEMQPALPRVTKRGSIDLGRGKPIAFARWEDVDRVLRPILSRHGFSLSFPTRLDGDRLVMACVVSHIAGHSERSESVVQSDAGPGRNAMQATGSGRSYTKRYLALDMLNIVTEGTDDDANSADPISDEQALKLHEMLDYLAMTPKQMEGFWKWAAAPENRAEAIQRKDYDRIHAELARRVKAQEAQRGAK